MAKYVVQFRPVLWGIFVLCITTAIALKRDDALVFVAGLMAVLLLQAQFWWSRPRYLVMALIVYFVLQDGLLTLFHHNVTFARVMPDICLLLVFLTRCIMAYRSHERFWHKGIEAPLLFILAVALLSAILNHIPPQQAVQGPYTMLRYVLIFYLIANSKLTGDEMFRFLRVLAWVVIAEGILGLAQFALIHTAWVRYFSSAQVQGTMDQYNIFSVFLALTLLILLATYPFSDLEQHRWELYAALTCGSGAMLLTLSRQGLLGLCVGVFTLALLSRHRWTRAKIWHVTMPLLAPLFMGLVVVGMLILFPVSCQAFSRAGPPTTTKPIAPPNAPCNAHTSFLATILAAKSPQNLLDAQFTSNARLYTIVNAAPAIWERSPVVGLGPGTFGSQPTFADEQFYAQLHVATLFSNPGAVLVADDEWMSIFGQLGVLGVLGFLWLFGSVGYRGYRLWQHAAHPLAQRLGAACVAFVPFFLLLGWFGPNFEIRQISSLLWFSAGSALALATYAPTEPTKKHLATIPAEQSDSHEL